MNNHEVTNICAAIACLTGAVIAIIWMIIYWFKLSTQRERDEIDSAYMVAGIVGIPVLGGFLGMIALCLSPLIILILITKLIRNEKIN